MKKSVTIWALAGGTEGTRSVVEAARLVQSAGFDAIEASFFETGELSLETTTAGLKRLRDEIASFGGAVSSISSLLFNRISLTAAAAHERRYARKVAMAMMDAAAALGVETVSVSPGRVTPSVDYVTAYGRALEQVAAIGQRARALGVKVGVENVWQGLLLSPREFARFIDEVGNDHVGACLDVGNTTLAGFPQHWVTALGSRIVKIHVTDTRKRQGLFLQFVDPGSGDVDWSATMEALERTGYNSWATVEAFADGKTSDEDYLLRLSHALDNVLA